MAQRMKKEWQMTAKGVKAMQMDTGSGHGSAATGLAIDLQFVGSGPVVAIFHSLLIPLAPTDTYLCHMLECG